MGLKKMKNKINILAICLMLSAGQFVYSSTAASVSPSAVQNEASNKKFTCISCQKEFQQENHLLRHVLLIHESVNVDAMTYGALYYAQQNNLDLTHYGLSEYSLPPKPARKNLNMNNSTNRSVSKAKKNIKRKSTDDDDFDPVSVEEGEGSDGNINEPDASNQRKRLKIGLEKNRNFICEMCNKGFTDRNNMKRHQRFAHQGASHKRVRCDECNQTQSNIQNWVRHKVVQHKFKPFKCDFKSCKEAFIKEGELKKHLLNEHKIKIFKRKKYCINYADVLKKYGVERSESSSPLDSVSSDSDSENGLKAEKEERSSSSSTLAANDVKARLKKDDTKKLYKCKCNQGFISFRAFMRHVLFKHKNLDWRLIIWQHNRPDVFSYLKARNNMRKNKELLTAPKLARKYDLIGGSIMKASSLDECNEDDDDQERIDGIAPLRISPNPFDVDAKLFGELPSSPPREDAAFSSAAIASASLINRSNSAAFAAAHRAHEPFQQSTGDANAASIAVLGAPFQIARDAISQAQRALTVASAALDHAHAHHQSFTLLAPTMSAPFPPTASAALQMPSLEFGVKSEGAADTNNYESQYPIPFTAVRAPDTHSSELEMNDDELRLLGIPHNL